MTLLQHTILIDEDLGHLQLDLGHQSNYKVTTSMMEEGELAAASRKYLFIKINFIN